MSWIIGTSLPPSFAAVFGLAMLASIALRRDSGGAAVLLAAVAAVAVAAEALRPMVGAAGYLLSACAMGFAVAVSVGVYLRWSDWRQVTAAQAARVDERLEIARELHDMAGHHVTAMVVQAQAARHVAGSQPAAAVAALDRIETCGIETLVAMRRIVGGLRTDAPVGPTSTWDDVDRLIADAAAQGQPVQALIDPEVRTAAPTLAASAHRIIAESLTNVRRHGHDVGRVDVSVIGRPDGVAVIVHDDGRVRGASGQDGFGIVGMYERAASLGGSLSAGPAPDGGWVVHAELPIDHRR